MNIDFTRYDNDQTLGWGNFDEGEPSSRPNASHDEMVINPTHHVCSAVRMMALMMTGNQSVNLTRATYKTYASSKGRCEFTFSLKYKKEYDYFTQLITRIGGKIIEEIVIEKKVADGKAVHGDRHRELTFTILARRLQGYLRGANFGYVRNRLQVELCSPNHWQPSYQTPAKCGTYACLLLENGRAIRSMVRFDRPDDGQDWEEPFWHTTNDVMAWMTESDRLQGELDMVNLPYSDCISPSETLGTIAQALSTVHGSRLHPSDMKFDFGFVDLSEEIAWIESIAQLGGELSLTYGMLAERALVEDDHVE